MTLDAQDIALLRAMIREEMKISNNQDLQLQAEYLVTLPVEERKRRAKAAMLEENRQRKLKAA